MAIRDEVKKRLTMRQEVRQDVRTVAGILYIILHNDTPTIALYLTFVATCQHESSVPTKGFEMNNHNTEEFGTLPAAAKLKIELMFDGVRYSEALGEAVEHAFPNFFPYRFQKGEDNPTGALTARIPYMMIFRDGTHVRLKGNGQSPWIVKKASETGYQLSNADGRAFDITFEPLPRWMTQESSDGTPLARSGLSLHGDMAVVNVAPGCQYFVAEKQNGKSMRCTFCTYGAPDSRMEDLSQEVWEPSLPDQTYSRLKEALVAAISESEINQIYLVGGSMTDWHQEGERFIELARRVQDVVHQRVPLTCGSGALPEESLRILHGEGLVQNACFNLEVWSKPLFERICPGKERYVGYEHWIQSLEQAVGLWGPERVYSAMVAGIELEPEYGMTWQDAADLAIAGADDLCSRGIIPIYSLYWPVGGRDHPDYMSNLLAYFERLCLGYSQIRRKHGLNIWDGFMSEKGAYMQVECDIDRAN